MGFGAAECRKLQKHAVTHTPRTSAFGNLIAMAGRFNLAGRASGLLKEPA